MVWIYVLSPAHTHQRRQLYEAARVQADEIANEGTQFQSEPEPPPSEITKVHEETVISVAEVQNGSSGQVYETGVNQFIEMDIGDIFEDEDSHMPPPNSDPLLSSVNAVEVSHEEIDDPVIGKTYLNNEQYDFT